MKVNGVGWLGSGWVVKEIERVGGWSVYFGFMWWAGSGEGGWEVGFGGLGCERLRD